MIIDQKKLIKYLYLHKRYSTKFEFDEGLSKSMKQKKNWVKIQSIYARGIFQKDISKTVEDIYALSISCEMISYYYRTFFYFDTLY